MCRYNGEALWHERLLLQRFGGAGSTEWAIVTPDGDVYVEDFSDTTCAESIRLIPSTGGRPTGLVGKIYPFRAQPTPELRKQWKLEGELAISALKAERQGAPAPAKKTRGGSE